MGCLFTFSAFGSCAKMTDRTLIVGTSYVHGRAATEVYRMWAHLVTKLNPGMKVLQIDASSPALPKLPGVQVYPVENFGHLSRGGRDGWGLSFTTGVRSAIGGGYDWLVNIETDVLFARPVGPIINRLIRHGINCAAPMAIPHSFTATELSFWNVEYLRQIDLIGKYDWKNPPAGVLPEQRIDAICAYEMFALPLRGMRNDHGIPASVLRRAFPAGIDWITHAELPVCLEFLRMNGIEWGI